MLLVTYRTQAQRLRMYRIRDLNRWIWNAEREIPLLVLTGHGDLVRETKLMICAWMRERDALIDEAIMDGDGL